jgi:hypothetical protein
VNVEEAIVGMRKRDVGRVSVFISYFYCAGAVSIYVAMAA